MDSVWSAIFRSNFYLLLYFLIVKSIGYILSSIIVASDFEFLYNIDENYFDLIDTVLYLSVVLVLMKFIRIRGDSLEINNPLLKLGPIIIVVLLIFNFRIFEDPIFNIENIISQTPLSNDEINKLSTLKVITIILNVILLGPILEELLFRKLMIGEFIRNKHLWLGILYVSILFGLWHISFYHFDIITFFLSFLFALISSFIYIKLGLRYSIIFHSGYNILWLVIYLNSSYYKNFINGFGFSYWLIVSISFIIIASILYFVIRRNYLIKNAETAHE